MLKFIFLLLFSFSASGEAIYKVIPGLLHRKGKITIDVIPEENKFKVRMAYDIQRKQYVMVPDKLLKGETIMEFPEAFKTEAGYQDLEKRKSMMVPKAKLVFKKRGDIDNLKDAYFIQVQPTNKKSEIDIVYHPSLPEVGWKEMELTFLSKIPILNGYDIKAKLK